MSPENMKLKLFTGNANPELARDIADYLEVPMGRSRVGRFSDGEIQVRIFQTVRGDDVFVVQPVCNPINENLMELLVMIDAFKRASAGRITSVLPYYGYARQDRKSKPREPITAKLVANLLDVAGADRVLALDLHAGQIQGFFDIPVDSLVAIPLLTDYFLAHGLGGEDTVVVSPDVGGVKRVRTIGEKLKSAIAIIDKRRPKPNVTQVMNIVGEIEGKNAVLVDDMVDTGGTFCEAASLLKEKGAEKIYACCTHPVLSGDAVDKLAEAPIEKLVTTNTIPVGEEKNLDKFEVLSVAPLIGEAIERIYNNLSVSVLFD